MTKTRKGVPSQIGWQWRPLSLDRLSLGAVATFTVYSGTLNQSMVTLVDLSSLCAAVCFLFAGLPACRLSERRRRCQ